MIIIKLQGGLGNQLFQYSVARALAARHKTDLKLDIEWYKKSPNRTYDLERYNISADMATKEEVKKLKGGGLKSILGTGNLKTYLKEKTFTFDPEILQAGPDTYLEGYFQSEKYFLEIADIIKEEFVLKTEAKDLNATLLKDITEAQAVSLHVRRGDYVSSKSTNSYHGTSSLDYYQKAVNFVAGKVSNPHFYIFSDDPEWTKENLKVDHPATYVIHNGAAAQEDLRLMSNCKHFILANSTFSWWGAWLAANPEKIVIAPERWFATNENDTKDLIPSSWIRL
jgi:hypothetical protein